jgi:hypothetical protein
MIVAARLTLENGRIGSTVVVRIVIPLFFSAMLLVMLAVSITRKIT